MSLTVTPKRTARRCLFGRPTEDQQEKTKQWLANALDDMMRKDCEKWGFDFKLGVPLEEASCSLYSYDAVSEAEVPEFYRTKHIRSSPSPMSSPGSSEKDASLLNVSSCTESDVSMDFEPVPQSKRVGQTPKKRQHKLTDFIPIRRKKLSRSPKDIVGTSQVRSPRRAARHF